MAEVKLDKIDKIYENGVQAVFSANFTIKDKEFVVLVGPSGCGKTTTLRMIAGLEDISAGSLYIDDKMVNDVPPKDRDIAMVFQNYALYPHMSVYDNMAFGLKIRKMSKKEIDEKVQNAAKILDINEFLQRKPKQLSGGQRQRVALGRAIVRDPKVFLFDEPLSNLDAKLRVQMRTEISALHNKLKATMVYVTHDQIEAMTMGDRIVIMKKGIIQQIGTPIDLYNTPINKFVAGFIGSPPMNFMNVQVEQQNNNIFLNEGKFRIKLDESKKSILKNYIGQLISVGIRPENILYDPNFNDDEEYIIGDIQIIEPLGAETHIYINTGKHQIICRIEPNHIFQLGQTIKLKPLQEKFLFFDIKTEDSIGLDIDSSEWDISKK